MTAIRVYIVDDQPLIRDGLADLVDRQKDMTVAGTAGTARDALVGIREAAPDVVLLDIRLPDGSGLDVARELNHQASGPKVLLLTTFDVDEYVVRALRAGAMGYVLKDLPTQELFETIRAVSRGEAIYRTQSASWALSQVVGPSQGLSGQTASDAPVEPLTERERDVLRRMAQGERNADIAQALYLSEGTVKTHVHSILQKLGANDRTQAVVWAFRHGWVE